MIAVIAKAGQSAWVGEFFQLFKTPWEFYRPGRAYDVVVATASEIPEVDARLFVICGADLKNTDARHGVLARSRHRGGLLNYGVFKLPVYGEVLTFEPRGTAVPCVAAGGEAAGLRIRVAEASVVRLGYDLFAEVGVLLSAGQPLEYAHVPTLDLHIMMLREWILNAGIALVEIPPVPVGHDFAVCLTHDIDFGGMRNHRFDHTMWGFVYRSTVGAVRNLLRGRLSKRQLFQSWRAAASLPLVFMGWARDFWEPFGWYLKVERGLPATYFAIPFRGRPGSRVAGKHASRRRAAYDLSDLANGIAALLRAGGELAVHGIDAWHSVEKGRDERARIAAVSGKSSIGIRMHWLLLDQGTFSVLDEAGFAYDSTFGYNETVGYRGGTTQVFCPAGARALLELPLHIQDGALFYPERLDLPQSEAWRRCEDLIDHARAFGGVLTILWHDRSPGPERFWGDFYVRLVQDLNSLGAWFGTAGQVVDWFRKRRAVNFERVGDAGSIDRVCLRYQGEEIRPPLTVRVHRPSSPPLDLAWNGETHFDIDRALRSPAPDEAVGSSLL
ncbi:MAG: hypothetical protein DMG76_29785 [Acidobacteria bacterium]|nr:MAG: hypothetical protein DMG76_29785 [Acidobacteriota bacterium]